jgi:mannose-1-phosphate guanylyltransferase
VVCEAGARGLADRLRDPSTEPATVYRYIRLGNALGGGFRVDRFVEKPDLATARSLLSEGALVWNGGIFCMRGGRYLEELVRYWPALAANLVEALARAKTAGWQCHPRAAPFAAITGESIEYAVMENTNRIAMVTTTKGWSDIGNWNAVLAPATPLSSRLI